MNKASLWRLKGVTRKVFARLTQKCLKITGKFLDNLKTVRTMYIVRTVWKVSRQSEVSVQSGNCPDSQESVRTVWKVSGQSGK